MRAPRALLPPRALERREVGILALFAVIGVTQGWAGAAITHTLPFIQRSFELSDARVFDLMALVRAVALIALGLSWWSDSIGRRRPLLIAFMLLTLGNLATAILPGLAWYAALQSITRIGNIAIASLAIVVLAEEIGREVRGYAIAVFTLSGSLGTGLGLLLRPLAGIGDEGWRLLFLLSALPVLAAPLLAARLKESRIFRRPPTRPSLGRVLKRGYARIFWPMALLSFALSAFSSPAANLALVRLENELAWSTGGASMLLIGTSAPGVALGLLIGGRLADVVGRRPTEAIAVFIGVGGGVLFYFAQGVPMGVGIFLSTFGASAFAPAYASHRSELFPTEMRSTASAWLVNASILGGLAGFAAGRFVVDAWGLAPTIAALGGFLLCASAAILVLPETRGLRLRPPGEDSPGHTASTPE